jgi:hypothetical protein
MLKQKTEEEIENGEVWYFKQGLCEKGIEIIYWCVRAIVRYGGHIFTLFTVPHSPTDTPLLL